MLNLCSSGHKEICHQGHTCPVCEALELVAELNKLVAIRDLRVEELEDRVSELKKDLCV